MVRKCSRCGKCGHNSRTCRTKRGYNGGKIRLFGVQIDAPLSSSSCSSASGSSSISMAAILDMNKSLNTGCFQSSSSSSCSLPSTDSSCSNSNSHVSIDENQDNLLPGYLSDGLLGRGQQMKKGMAWTEEEKKRFVRGLEKLGKGDWRGISKNFVRTRTPTQVASHAQKYFLRQTNLRNNKHPPTLSTNFIPMVGSKNWILEYGKSNSKASDTFIQFGLSAKTISTKHKHEISEPGLTHDFKQTSLNEALNLELTLEMATRPPITHQECHLRFV